MPDRHFAFFSQSTGECLREAMVPVAHLRLLRVAQALGATCLLDAWATRISRPRRGEVGLDVTHLGWPLGDFAWARFDAIDRRLSFPHVHHFLTVRESDGFVCGNTWSARPVRDFDDAHFVIDVTGTPLESTSGRPVHGYLARVDDRLAVGAALLRLPEASPALELVRVAQPVLVGA